MPKKKKTDVTADVAPVLFGEPEPTPNEDPVSVEDQIKALTTSVAALTKANEGLVADHKKAQDLTMTLLATPADAVMPVIPTAPATFQAADLPDPVEDPKGYFAAVNKQISDGVAGQMAAFREDEDQKVIAENALANQVDGLWNRFTKAHPDLAKYKGLVNVAAQEVVETARAKGIDGEKFMFGAGSERFLEDVAESVTTTIKSIQDDGEEDPKTPKKDPEEDPAPALGVLPGLPVASSGGDSEEAKNLASGASGLVADIKKGQEVSGFF